MDATTPASNRPRRTGLIRTVLALIIALVVVDLAVMWWWDKEPESFDPVKAAAALCVGG